MQQVTNDNFHDEVIGDSFDYPVLVQFWAPWCGPCHGLTATLDQMEAERQFPVKYVGLDVDQYTDLALQFRIMGVPHTRIYASGQVLDQFSDPLPRQEIELFIRNALVTPVILKYSHFAGDVDADIIMELEDRSPQSRRKDVYFLTLARHYFFSDREKSLKYLNLIPDNSDQFEDRLFIKDLYPIADVEFSPDPTGKKLWAARNALLKKNFESTYQFLLQANRISSGDPSGQPRSFLMAFNRFLGENHELNRKYLSQFTSVINAQ